MKASIDRSYLAFLPNFYCFILVFSIFLVCIKLRLALYLIYVSIITYFFCLHVFLPYLAALFSALVQLQSQTFAL